MNAGYEDHFGTPSWVAQPGNIEEAGKTLFKGHVVAVLASLGGSDSGAQMDEMITWESLKSPANKCKEYQELRDAVTSGFFLGQR